MSWLSSSVYVLVLSSTKSNHNTCQLASADSTALATFASQRTVRPESSPATAIIVPFLNCEVQRKWVNKFVRTQTMANIHKTNFSFFRYTLLLGLVDWEYSHGLQSFTMCDNWLHAFLLYGRKHLKTNRTNSRTCRWVGWQKHLKKIDINCRQCGQQKQAKKFSNVVVQRSKWSSALQVQCQSAKVKLFGQIDAKKDTLPKKKFCLKIHHKLAQKKFLCAETRFQFFGNKKHWWFSIKRSKIIDQSNRIFHSLRIVYFSFSRLKLDDRW